MSGRSSSRSNGFADRTASLARVLLAADDLPSALLGWLSHTAVDADLVTVLEAESDLVGPAFRREGNSFLPLPMPPVAAGPRPASTIQLALGGGRGTAFEDLLFSLGLAQVLALPLLPEIAGVLTVARTGASFRSDEIASLEEDALLLGPTLARFVRQERRERVESSSSAEVAELFELTRELSRVPTPSKAVAVTIDALRRHLEPFAGAIVVELAAGQDALVESWPNSAKGQEAAAVAAGAIDSDSLSWVIPPADGSAVRMALGWPGRVPRSATRLIEAVHASLSMAIDRLESERLREENRLKDTVEGLPLGVALLTRRGQIRLVNHKATELLEKLDAWHEGGSGLVRKLGSVELMPMIAEASEGRANSAEVFFPEGSRTLEVRVVPALRRAISGRDASGDVLLVLDDVSEMLRQKRQLVQAEKLSALGTLISGVVHELNNPLSTILGYAQMSVGVPDSPTRGEWMKTILEEGQRCHRIVNNMLALARRQDGGHQILSLKAIAERALSLVAYPFRTASIEASLRIDTETPAVLGDQDALLQVMINLLTNALHALENYSGRREVRVEIGPGGDGKIVLAIGDSGPGIPEALRVKVFDAFFTTKDEGKGTGLGLAQVASTVQDHSGTIRIESGADGGAVFRIELPVAEVREACACEAEPEVLPVTTSLGGARVMVIDDEPAVADCLAEVLGHSGARVSVYHGAEEALGTLLRDAPDVIVSDLKMPRVSGENLLEELQRDSPHLVPRLVFTTGDLEAAAASSVLKRAGRPCLAKPFDFREVLRVVAETYSLRVAPPVSRSPVPPICSPKLGADPFP